MLPSMTMPMAQPMTDGMQPPMPAEAASMTPVMGEKAQFLQQLAAQIAAQNVGPSGMTGGGDVVAPQSLEEALAIITQQRSMISDLQAQISANGQVQTNV